MTGHEPDFLTYIFYLELVDVSDPSSPQKLGEYKIRSLYEYENGGPYEILVSGNTVFLADWWSSTGRPLVYFVVISIWCSSKPDLMVERSAKRYWFLFYNFFPGNQ